MRLSGRVLAIAGSDCGGGAGIQADIKTLTALGAYAATAITALTVQDTQRVHQLHKVAPAVIAAQIACVLADPGVDAIKTGMLVDAATIAAVSAALAGQGRGLPIVLDPVMIATSGDRLLADDAIAALKSLFARATLITPNAQEAGFLCGRAIRTLADQRDSAAMLIDAGAASVLVKGAHLDDAEITDLLVTRSGETRFTHPRQRTTSTHGTGCTLAAAIAAGLAQQMSLIDAVGRAIGYVQQAIAQAPGFGAGNGPLNHAVTVHPAGA